MISWLRVIIFGFQGFRRNIWLSLVAVFTMALMLVTMTIFSLANTALVKANKDFNEKIDYIIFVKDSAPETDVDIFRQQINNRSEVDKLTYFNKDQVRERFDQVFANEASLQGVITPESNPLPREIDVTFKDVTQIKAFNDFISQDRYAPLVEKTSYYDNQKSINNYLNFSKFIRYFGWAMSAFLILVAVIVVFNTIRLAIFSRREEIEIMRLVGATWQYIRGPFLFEGFLYGLLGAMFGSLLIYLVLTQLLNLVMQDLNFFNANSLSVITYLAKSTMSTQTGVAGIFSQLLGTQLVVGIVLGVLCSGVAVKKYLREN